MANWLTQILSRPDSADRWSGSQMSIFDVTGAERGFVDLIAAEKGRLIVAGWVQAAQVELLLADQRAAFIPNMPRPDVAAVKGIDSRVGFDVRVRASSQILADCEPPGLTFVPLDGAHSIPPLSLQLVRG
ncbi:hypothetical protein [uncultured Tateyamaria sp.]|uniref:hypothetical protein n=1 Tax=uncultured Tateyamaria sp. TaxID=455651 RepID=UPI00261AD5D2|nr:hypothetical protein [uncultured Tateyamaria sp.]